MTKLTLKQKLFCQAYVETLGNATEAVIKARYDVKNKDGRPNRIVAKSIASENLTKPYICGYIKSLLNKNGLNDQSVGMQLNFLISQFSDLSVKARAIDIYYKMKGTYAPEKFEIKNQSVFTDDQINRIAKRVLDKQTL